MSIAFDRLVPALESQFHTGLPGPEAQQTMAPRYDAGHRRPPTKDTDCTNAGVLALLYPNAHGVPTILLTVRRSDLSHHPGQISFPGGRCEPGEVPCDTALREAHEEVGLPPGASTILGSLTSLYIPPSGFCVHPFVAVCPRAPAFTAQEAEVEMVLPASLPHLLDPGTRTVEPWTLHGRSIDVPYYAVDGHAVWGATAMMLAELLQVVRQASGEFSGRAV
jgi:8-oxo-dGTP pyrophosphatase MutT (NUDIX family)